MTVLHQQPHPPNLLHQRLHRPPHQLLRPVLQLSSTVKMNAVTSMPDVIVTAVSTTSLLVNLFRFAELQRSLLVGSIRKTSRTRRKITLFQLQNSLRTIHSRTANTPVQPILSVVSPAMVSLRLFLASPLQQQQRAAQVLIAWMRMTSPPLFIVNGELKELAKTANSIVGLMYEGKDIHRADILPVGFGSLSSIRFLASESERSGEAQRILGGKGSFIPSAAKLDIHIHTSIRK